MNELLQLSVKNIIRETDDANTYVLEYSGAPVNYRAGQFLTFIFELNGRHVRRSYSLISSPVTDPDLAVTIKRVVNGELSRYLSDHLKKGDGIQSLYPSGRFTIEFNREKRHTYFFLAAGSGITPIYSLIKTVIHEEPFSNIILIYSSVSKHKTIFNDQIRELEKKHPLQLKCIFLYSSKGERLNNSRLEKLVRENQPSGSHSCSFYMCGPSDYMRMAILTLTYMGFSKDQLFKEHFGAEELPQAESVLIPGNAEAREVRVFYKNNMYSITVPPYKSILDAALLQNISLPYSCRAGICSTCSAICRKGKVEMTVNEVLTERDIEQGWILTCTGYPLTDETEIVVGGENL